MAPQTMDNGPKRLTEAEFRWIIAPKNDMAAPKIDSIDLAKLLLAKGGPLPHLKLQKLLYYVEAWHLAILGDSIITDEFKAWMHGPVSTKVWHAFKDVTHPVFNKIKIPASEAKAAIARIRSVLDPAQISLIDDVLKEYGKLNAYELEALTHSEAPWVVARKGVSLDSASNSAISKELMKKFYSRRLYGESSKAKAA
jgi:uncharacterized phage-associated protein